MDNIFEILIYLFIIISFLSSFFKKKKQPQKPPPVQQPREDDYSSRTIPTAQTKTSDEYDILAELEDFFKVGNEPTPKEKSIPQQQSESSATMKEQVATDEWHSPTQSEHTLDRWERKRGEVQKILAGVDSAIEKKAAMFEDSLVKKEDSFTSLALAVKSRIRTPSVLKEYVIFSEILGKPKAMRR